MTRKDWYLIVAVALMVLSLHALIPRYEWRAVAEERSLLIRIDRWTGRAQLGWVSRGEPKWTPLERRP